MVNFQYYDTLQNKSSENLLYFIESIAPNFTIGELKIFLEEILTKASKDTSKSETNNINKYIDIGADFEKIADLSKLNQDQMEIIYKFFISREINDKVAVKWRFYQNLKYLPDLVIENVKINCMKNPEQLIDLIIKEDNGKIMFVLCYNTLDLDNYNKGIQIVIDFSKISNITPDRILFATNKSYRNIPINQKIQIDGISIEPELWIEWIEQNCPFNGEDLIILNNHELELAGFNFINIQDLLDFIYEFSEGDQVSIYRQPGYFSENRKEVQQIELIWKGIMLKNIN